MPCCSPGVYGPPRRMSLRQYSFSSGVYASLAVLNLGQSQDGLRFVLLIHDSAPITTHHILAAPVQTAIWPHRNFTLPLA